jgi:beta-lactamase regulating signal transducer with metallopeptidase domain
LLRHPVRRLFGASVAYTLWLIPAVRAILPSFTQTIERVVPAPLPSDLHIAAARLPEIAPSVPAFAADWPLLLAAIWLSGAGAMLLRGTFVYHRQRRAILGNAVRMARLGSIRIMRSERVRGPIAFGILDRVIVVPLDFDDSFSDRQRCFALEHELSHHRNGDMIANLFAFVLLCLQWFNPLAWAAHAAFRFDQEAACDARVLDKAQPGERASYGAAIAKAASGRTFLIAGALDRPSTLSRRLTIMTNIQNERRRRAGFVIVGGALLIALPLTASWAIDYVDVAAPASPAAPNSPIAPIKPVEALAPVVPTPPVQPAAVHFGSLGDDDDHFDKGDINFISGDRITIDGKTKRWEELTPAERARIRTETAKARKELEKHMSELPQQLANAEAELAKFRNGDFQREMAKARADMRESLADIDKQAKIIRATGEDPAKMRAEIQKSLAEIEHTDFDKIAREATVNLDPARIKGNLAEAMRSLDEIQVKLDALDRR